MKKNKITVQRGYKGNWSVRLNGKLRGGFPIYEDALDFANLLVGKTDNCEFKI